MRERQTGIPLLLPKRSNSSNQKKESSKQGADRKRIKKSACSSLRIVFSRTIVSTVDDRGQPQLLFIILFFLNKQL